MAASPGMSLAAPLILLSLGAHCVTCQRPLRFHHTTLEEDKPTHAEAGDLGVEKVRSRGPVETRLSYSIGETRATSSSPPDHSVQEWREPQQRLKWIDDRGGVSRLYYSDGRPRDQTGGAALGLPTILEIETLPPSLSQGQDQGTLNISSSNSTSQIANTSISNNATTNKTSQITNTSLSNKATTNKTSQITNTSLSNKATTNKTSQIANTSISNKATTNKTSQIANTSLSNKATTNKTSQIANTSLSNNATTNSRSVLVWRTDREWGSHPLPPLDTFTSSVDGAKWVAYFHDQAIAAVQQTKDGAILSCTVQEVIEVWEQREARLYLGKVMPLLPVPLSRMIHLIALCGTINRPPPPATHHTNDQPTESLPLWFLGSSALQGIFPGTLWCGRSDVASSYHHLGQKADLDACCRDHDHCPVKLLPLKTRYGITNFGFSTRSHCACDLEFFRCLKAVGSKEAAAIGKLFFNFLHMQCIRTVSSSSTPPHSPSRSIPHNSQRVNKALQEPPPTQHTVVEVDLEVSGAREKENGGAPSSEGTRLDCTLQDKEDGTCRMWLHNPKGFTQRYAITPNKLVF